jgi:hypothetical protein
MPSVYTPDPRKKSILAIVSTGQGRRCGRQEFAGSGDRDGRVRGGARPGAHLGLGGDRSWGKGVANEGAQRRKGLAAAAVRLPARRPAGLANKQTLGVECKVGKVLGGRPATEERGDRSSATVLQWRRGGGAGTEGRGLHARGERVALFIGGEQCAGALLRREGASAIKLRYGRDISRRAHRGRTGDHWGVGA